MVRSSGEKRRRRGKERKRGEEVRE